MHGAVEGDLEFRKFNEVSETQKVFSIFAIMETPGHNIEHTGPYDFCCTLGAVTRSSLSCNKQDEHFSTGEI